MAVILAYWVVEIKRIEVPGQPREKVLESPSQSIKAGCGGVHLSSQLGGKH
jgi:hypothetical protein